MKIIVSMLFILLAFLPGYAMEDLLVLEEKLILVVEASNNNRAIIPTTIMRHMEEHLAARFGGNEVPLNTYFDLTCGTPQEAREQFPSSPLYIVTLGVGEAPMDYDHPEQSTSFQYNTQMGKLANEMMKELLPLKHRRIQVILNSSTLKSNNEEAFKQAAHSVANPMNQSPQGYPIFKEIIDKICEHKNKSAK